MGIYFWYVLKNLKKGCFAFYWNQINLICLVFLKKIIDCFDKICHQTIANFSTFFHLAPSMYFGISNLESLFSCRNFINAANNYTILPNLEKCCQIFHIFFFSTYQQFNIHSNGNTLVRSHSKWTLNRIFSNMWPNTIFNIVSCIINHIRKRTDTKYSQNHLNHFFV